MPELIVLRPALRVLQHLVRLGRLSKFLLRRLVARIFIRMVFHGHSPVGFLDLILGGIFLYAKYFVIIGFIGHLV